MTKLKLNVHDTAAVPVEQPKVEVRTPVESKSFKDKDFHNWDLKQDGDFLKGFNKVSKETFAGTFNEFRERMRG